MNVGVSTLVDFLHKKGFADITEDLNQKLTDEQYNLLVAEYSQDKTIREEAKDSRHTGFWDHAEYGMHSHHGTGSSTPIPPILCSACQVVQFVSTSGMA